MNREIKYINQKGISKLLPNALLLCAIVITISSCATTKENNNGNLIIKEQGAFPTWGMQLPPPMKSFLHQYDLSGKKVIPFNTNGGYGIGNSFQTVKELCPDNDVLEGFTAKGGSERDGILYVMDGDKEMQVQGEVKKWLQKIGVAN